jgi:DNA-binding LytR/AlgR family response regulator
MNKQNIIFHEYKLEISVNGKTVIYPYGDILYIVAEKPYCKVCCVDNKQYLLLYPLDKFINVLPDCFFQCNRSTIINLSWVKEYDCTKDMKVVMNNNNAFSISRNRKDDLRKTVHSIARLTVPFEQCSRCDSESFCCSSYRAKLPKNDEKLSPF